MATEFFIEPGFAEYIAKIARVLKEQGEYTPWFGGAYYISKVTFEYEGEPVELSIQHDEHGELAIVASALE